MVPNSMQSQLFSKPVSISGGSRTATLDPFVVVQTLYSRAVKSPHDVARLVTYSSALESTAASPADRKIEELYKDMFECRLLHWLHGPGHPNHHLLRDAMQLDDNSRGDPTTLRARLLLKAVTESEELPVDPSWRLEVRHASVWTDSAVSDTCLTSSSSVMRMIAETKQFWISTRVLATAL